MKRRPPLYINGRFLTQGTTGVQRYAIELLKAMDVQLSRAAPSPEGWPACEILVPRGTTVPPLHFIRARPVGRLSGQLWEQIELPFHSRQGLLFNPCNVAPLVKRNKVVTLHDAAVFTHAEAYTGLFGRWYRFMLKRLCRSGTPVITVSEFARGELMFRCGLPLENSVVIYHGHEHIHQVPADDGILDRLGLRGTRFALAVSSQNPTKNLAGLSLALELLESPDFSVVVAGGKNHRIFNGDANPWPPFVHRAGYVNDGELRTLYESTACFVFPSLYEGFGIPPIEALACGATVLAADIPPLREVYGQALRYCDPADPHAIATGLLDAMKSESRDETAIAACLHKLTWAHCAEQTLQFIGKVQDSR